MSYYYDWSVGQTDDPKGLPYDQDAFDIDTGEKVELLFFWLPEANFIGRYAQDPSGRCATAGYGPDQHLKVIYERRIIRLEKQVNAHRAVAEHSESLRHK